MRSLAAFLMVGFVLTAAPRERRVAVEYLAKADAKLTGKAGVWVPIPTDDEYQRIERLRVTAIQPHQIFNAQNGNRYLHTSVGGGDEIKIEFTVARRERLQPVLRVKAQDPGPRCCLGPDRLVPIDGQIRTWAEELVRAARARTDVEKARAIYNHVVATVKYDKSGKGWGRGDIYYACDARRGNCSDFHAIFIGYSRAVGVPARFAIGLPLPWERGSGEILGYHCWAEFYAKGIGWVPVDASEAAKDPSRREYFFGAHDENRVQLTRDRDLLLEPRQKGPPLNFFVYPYLEMDGKPTDLIRTRVTFRDLPVSE